MALTTLIAATRLLPGAAALLAKQAAELPQKDELCGPFCGLVALRAAGIGGRLDQDAVAVAAGSVRSAPPSPDCWPPGEQGRTDCRVALPCDDPAVAGTSAPGLTRAVERLSRGALAVLPACGEWTATGLSWLLAALAELPVVAVIANIATGELWDHGTSIVGLARYLDDGDHRAGSLSRWAVGHFVLLVGVLDGPAGTLVLVADTYPSLGDAGLHFQPLERVAAALRREGTDPGGLLLVVVPATHHHQLRELVTAGGLRAQLWENGSRDAAS